MADALRVRILAGELTPGTRLPPDTELRAEFGVGQSTVREAIRSLASENLVHTTRGVTGGTFLLRPPTSASSAPTSKPGSPCWRRPRV
nr:winged helix-turn-helix domain-containing protein [Gordonia sp. LAM0048]